MAVFSFSVLFLYWKQLKYMYDTYESFVLIEILYCVNFSFWFIKFHLYYIFKGFKAFINNSNNIFITQLYGFQKQLKDNSQKHL